MTAIYLIGFMGAGKTTVGKELGEQIGLPVIDTDEEIVEKIQMTINDIFASQGESAFRRLEEEVLRALPTERTIITTGGGIILSETNRRWMKEQGTVIFLYCHPNEIVQRLKDDRTRPLLHANKEAEIHTLFESRLPLYEDTADYTIKTTNKDIKEIVKEICRCLHV